MVQYNPLQYLPSALELPDSNDTPVDNELQVLVLSLLRGILALPRPSARIGFSASIWGFTTLQMSQQLYQMGSFECRSPAAQE